MDIQIVQEILITVITSVIGWLGYRIKKRAAKLEEIELKREIRENAVNDALRALCRDRILNTYRFNSKRNFISTQDLETVSKLFNAYKALGGNGTLTAIYEMTLKLPIKEE